MSTLEARISPSDRDAADRLERARRDLLDRAGGAHSAVEVAELLNISLEEVRERARQGLLLACRGPSEELRYPRAQFTEEGTIDGLEEVLDAMHVQDPWMRLQLFCDRDVYGALADGRVEDAVRAADSYLPRDEG